MSNGNNVNENRVKTPRIYAYNTNGTNEGTNNNVTRIFMSYYDNNSSDNPVVFRYGTVGATGTNNSDNFGGNLGYNYDAARYQNNAGTSEHGSFPQTNMANFRQIVADNNTGYKGSDYTAVGGLSDGRPVIAWYDSYNQRLLFSYGNGTPTSNTHSTANNNAIVTTTTQQWQQNARVVDTFRGTHVDMAVDAGNNVHLAYYDVGNGGLYYAYIPSNEVVSTAAIKTARVDTYLAVGTKLMINVRRETSGGNTYDVPYITYYHGSFSETKNAIRVAWRKDFTNDPNTGGIRPGTNSDDTFTGAWEVMTIPVRDVPLTTEFICNGVPNPSSAQGSWNDPNLTGGYSVPALTRGSVDLRNSIVVGYMTYNYYEGAMLKGNTRDY